MRELSVFDDDAINVHFRKSSVAIAVVTRMVLTSLQITHTYICHILQISMLHKSTKINNINRIKTCAVSNGA